MPRADVVVVGAGLAGLTCAAELAASGARVFVAAKGMASTHWGHGGVDVAATRESVTSREGIRSLAAIPGHPYAVLQPDAEAALAAHAARLARGGVALVGDLDAPLVQIPTAIGARRPAAVLPRAQSALLDPWGGDGLLLVGIGRYRDAWAAYAARNLAAAPWPDGPRELRAVEVELPGLDGDRNLNARSLALRFDDASWAEAALGVIAAAVPPGAWRIGVPAILGLERHAEVLGRAQQLIGHPVAEVPSLPPSVPGMRLFEILRRSILDAGGGVQIGFDVVDVERDGRRVTAIHTEAASRTLRLSADSFVLATGGIAGEGIRAHPGGDLEERVFGLPVLAPPRDAWFSDDPFASHPIERIGIRTDEWLRPVAPDGRVVLDNVRVIGSALAGMHYLEQRCGDGVALASAHHVARRLAAGGVPA